MSGQGAVPYKCAKCYGESWKPCRQTNAAVRVNTVNTEYTGMFQKWPQAGRLQPVLPTPVRVLPSTGFQGNLLRKSTYITDFSNPIYIDYSKNNNALTPADMVGKTDEEIRIAMRPPKAKKKPDGNIMASMKATKFGEQSCYEDSYQGYDLAQMKTSKQPPIKGKNNLQCPDKGDANLLPKSTFQESYVGFDKPERPKAIRPIQNTQVSKDPMPTKTEYTDTYESTVPVARRVPGLKRKGNITLGGSRNPEVVLISTCKADFTTPLNAERPAPFIPIGSDQFSKDKFEGSTTFADSYPPQKVSRRVRPPWGIKPPYKRPEPGGMRENSCYKHDYRNPEVIQPPVPIRPGNNKAAFVNSTFDPNLMKDTTYTTDFKVPVDGRPPDSFQLKRVFTPPKTKMACSTNMKDDFKGVHQDRAQPIKPRSNQQDLRDIVMESGTTYNESYLDPIVHLKGMTGSTIDASNNNELGSKGQRPLRASTTPMAAHCPQGHEERCCCFSNPSTRASSVIAYSRAPSSLTSPIPSSCAPYRRPLTQESGRPLTQESGRPQTHQSGCPLAQELGRPLTQESGRPLTQESGRPLTQESGRPLTQESGRPLTQESERPQTHRSRYLQTQDSGRPRTQRSEFGAQRAEYGAMNESGHIPSNLFEFGPNNFLECSPYHISGHGRSSNVLACNSHSRL